MDKIYEQAKDLHVAAYIAYVKKGDKYAYTDAECQKKFTTSELADAFKKGLLVIAEGVTYTPTSCKVEKNVATVTYVTADASTPTTAKLATIETEAEAAE